jgi:hypothetical protein
LVVFVDPLQTSLKTGAGFQWRSRSLLPIYLHAAVLGDLKERQRIEKIKEYAKERGLNMLGSSLGLKRVYHSPVFIVPEYLNASFGASSDRDKADTFPRAT